MSVLFNFSCNKDEDNLKETTLNDITEFKITKNTPNHIIAEYITDRVNFTYEAITDGTITTSTLIINYEGIISQTSFKVDPIEPGYKFAFHNDVIVEAEKIKKNFTAAQAENVAHLYENFGTLLLAEDIKREAPLAQSLYFHNAAVNTVARSIKTNQDCGCTPDPGYYADKTSFWCQEDFKIDVDKLLDIVKKGNFQLTEDQQKVYIYLKANTGKTITIDKIYSFSEPKETYMKRVEAFRLNYHPSAQSPYNAKERKKRFITLREGCKEGSDLGCCGNYSGCCWYDNGICFWHDVYCLCCNDWWCLWGCKKESFCE